MVSAGISPARCPLVTSLTSYLVERPSRHGFPVVCTECCLSCFFRSLSSIDARAYLSLVPFYFLLQFTTEISVDYTYPVI